MAISPLINAPILRQDSVIEIVRKGDGTQAHDEVFVTTSLTLAADLDSSEITLLLPMSSAAGAKPLLRYVEDSISDAVQFDPVERSVFDQQVADALADYDQATRDHQARLAQAISQASQGFGQAVLKVKPGQRDLRFFYSVAAASTGSPREFQLQILGPLASFILQPGGSISVTALLPRSASLVEAVALQDPNDASTGLPNTETATLAGRTVLGWLWQNDPLFRIRYSY